MTQDFQKEIKYIRDSMGGVEFQGAILAGGAITSALTKQKIADFDLYFVNKKSFDRAVEDAYDDGMWCVSISSRAITFVKDGIAFQLMYFKFFESADDIFNSFDFTCCMAAISLDTGELHFHPRFLADTNKRELVFNNGTEFPLASGIRVLKYQGRGYSISKPEMVKLLVSVSQKKIDSWEELKEQIGGHYGERVTLDTSKDFNAENLTAALDGVSFEGSAEAFDSPGNAEDALKLIWKQEQPIGV